MAAEAPPQHSQISQISQISEISEISEILEDDETRLSLVSQQLTQLDQDIIAQHAHIMTHLDLTDNRIQDGKYFDALTSLQTLILDKNELDTLSYIPVLPTVHTLWLNNNKFSDLSILLDQISNLFPNISYLSLLRNPCCPDLYFSDGVPTEAYKRYRLFVIWKLKKLQTLDATQVTDTERQEAERTGKFLQVARPDPKQYEQKQPKASLIEPALLDTSSTDPAKRPKPAAYLGKNRMKYDGRQSEGNRFILNSDL